MDKKQLACNNDLRLEQLASYEVSRGLTKGVDQQNLLAKFTEYKQLVRKGSFTLQQLEDIVYSKYGVLEADDRRAFLDSLMDLSFSKYKNGVKNVTKNEKNEKNSKEEV